MQDSETKIGNTAAEYYQIQWNGETLAVQSLEGGVQFLNAGGIVAEFDMVSGAGKSIHVLINGRSARLEYVDRAEDGALLFRFNGRRYRLPMMNRRQLLLSSIQGNQSEGRKQTALKAPMPGLVLRVMVSEGQTVQAGDPILVLESMKMENVLRAQSACTVASAQVQQGETVEKGQILVNFS